MKTETSASVFQLAGAACFGAVLGWFLYYLNRYRTDVKLADLATLVAAIGAGAVLTLFPAKTELFAAYAIGLAVGFFAYFVVLIVMVAISETSTVDWFINPSPGNRPMAAPESPINRAMNDEEGGINQPGERRLPEVPRPENPQQ
jgi:hypothetical protein